MRFLIVSERTNTGVLTSCSVLILSAVLATITNEIFAIDNNGEIDLSTSDILKLSPFKPDAIFFTIGTLNAMRSYNLLKAAKNLWPNVICVSGGIHMRSKYEEAFRYGMDIVVRHDIEPVINKIIEAINAKKRHLLIDHPISCAPEQFTLTEYKYLYKGNYTCIEKTFDFVISDRGCPFTCNFCSDEWTQDVRCSSVDYLMSCIEMTLQYNSQIKLMDCNFLLNTQKAMDFCKRMENDQFKKSNAKFSIQTHINSKINEDILINLQQAGVNNISFGIERGTKEALQLLNKKGGFDTAIKKIETCVKSGLTVGVNFLLGFPFENVSNLKEEVKGFIDIRDTGAIVSPFLLVPFPGTIYYDQYQHIHDWYLKDDYFNDFNALVESGFFETFDKGPIGLGWVFLLRNIYNLSPATLALIIQAAQEFGELRLIPVRKTAKNIIKI